MGGLSVSGVRRPFPGPALDFEGGAKKRQPWNKCIVLDGAGAAAGRRCTPDPPRNGGPADEVSRRE